VVTFLYQALLDAEATEQIGAEPHERVLTRKSWGVLSPFHVGCHVAATSGH
jgi:hypothetical protein